MESVADEGTYRHAGDLERVGLEVDPVGLVVRIARPRLEFYVSLVDSVVALEGQPVLEAGANNVAVLGSLSVSVRVQR